MMVAGVLRSEPVSAQLVAQLGFGFPGENLAPEVLEVDLRAMADSGHGQTAVTVLAQRIKSKPAEIEQWKPLALRLTTDSGLVRSSRMDSYYWKEVSPHFDNVPLWPR